MLDENEEERDMEMPKVVSREEWLRARKIQPLDHTPLGRQEDGSPMAWLRHHDRY